MTAKREPLTRPMIVKMCELSKEDPLGIRACVWNFVAIGTFSGYREQEYDMELPTEIRYYVLPSRTCVVRAFVMSNLICYDGRGVTIYKLLAYRELVRKPGQEFDVQKNMMNRQIVCVGRLPSLP